MLFEYPKGNVFRCFLAKFGDHMRQDEVPSNILYSGCTRRFLLRVRWAFLLLLLSWLDKSITRNYLQGASSFLRFLESSKDKIPDAAHCQ